MKSVRFGIMGAGGIANKFCDAAALCEGAEVTCVSSKTAFRAEDFAKRHNLAWSGSYEDMLAREDVDVVYIATTHNFHKDNILACLNAGKHVICEKPMVLTKADAEEVFTLAKEKGLFLMEAMWSRFLPTIQWAKKKLADGAIGELCTVNAVIGFFAGTNYESRIWNPALAGGALYDIGVYPLEIVSYLVGEPVQNVLSSARPNRITGVDECVSMIVEYPSVDAVIQCMVGCAPKEFALLSGTRGFMELPVHNCGSAVLLYDANKKFVEEFRPIMPDGNGFYYEVEEVVNCIRAGKIESSVMPAAATIECAGIFEDVLSRMKPLS